jgi:hypothetical protein
MPPEIYTRDYQLNSVFTLGKLCITEHRDFIDINFEESKKYLDNLKRVCNELLVPISVLLGEVPYITSGFRCDALNKSVGGTITSQHSYGEAVDTVYVKHNLKEVFNKIAFESSIQYSQIIFEFGTWIHIAVIDEVLYPGKKLQKLIASRQNSKVVYTPVFNCQEFSRNRETYRENSKGRR